jgi:uncharacterized protein (TIGR02996 family)
MHDDDFLRAILANPKDDAAVLIYSDWLDEQGDATSAAKAEFLRLIAEDGRRRGKKARQRLRELAAGLDTGWLAVVSRLAVENCLVKRRAGEEWPPRSVFRFRCDRNWDDLQPTDDQNIRLCSACSLSVHYCDTIGEARRHAAEGHCIAIDLGIKRRAGDLEPPESRSEWVGYVSPELIRRERERLQPDPVSQERERRKRAAQGNSLSE